MRTYIEIILLEYIFSLILTREFLLCAHGWAGQTHFYSWRRISQDEIRNPVAVKKIGIGISPKQKEEQAEDSSPDPSSSACDIRIQKKRISRSFAESFPQKIVSAKLRPHCFRFPHQGCFQKKFEFCPEHTVLIRKNTLI